MLHLQVVKSFNVANDVQLRITLIIVWAKHFLLQTLIIFQLYLSTGGTTPVTPMLHTPLGTCSVMIWLLQRVLRRLYYVGAPEYLTKRLQIITNAAARVVAGHSRFSPIISSASGYVWDVLHWLPAAQRIDVKVVRLAYKVLNGLAPSYPIEHPHWHHVDLASVLYMRSGWPFLGISTCVLSAHLWWPVH